MVTGQHGSPGYLVIQVCVVKTQQQENDHALHHHRRMVGKNVLELRLNVNLAPRNQVRNSLPFNYTCL